MILPSDLGLIGQFASPAAILVTSFGVAAIQIINERNLAAKRMKADSILHFAKEANERRRRMDQLIKATTKTGAKVDILASIVHNVTLMEGKGSGDSETGSCAGA